MKTKLLSLISVLCLFLLNSQTYIINDDFESDALGTLPDGWVIRYNGTGNANQKVVDFPVKYGSHSFQLSGSSWAANLSKNVNEMPNKVTLEGWMYAENVATGGRCGLGIGNPSSGTWGTLPARVEFYNGNLITYYHNGNSGGYGTQYVLQTATPNTWYHAKLEINRLSGTYEVYINGIQGSSNTGGTVTTEFPLLTTVNPTSVELYGNSKVYFDDVKLYETKPELVVYYPFNGNADDDSGNNLDGTVNGAMLTTDRFGNINSAYSFDGTDDIIIINHDDILNFSNKLSISVWIKPNMQQNAMILGKSNYTTTTNYLIRTKSTGFIQFEYKDFANSNSLPINVGTWNHIALISEADNSKRVYINGVLATHTNASSPFGLVNNELTIGARIGNEYFDGSIDDIRIYRSALTEEEVLNLFNFNNLSVAEYNEVPESILYVYDSSIFFNEALNLSTIKNISIYNLLAQNVFYTKTVNREVPLYFLDQGIYILMVEHTNGLVTTKKFLIN